MTEIKTFQDAVAIDVVAHYTSLATVVSGGDVANHYASQTVFDDYLRSLTPASLKAIHLDLDYWCRYLHAGKMIVDANIDQFRMPQAWAGVTWGIVKGFQEYLLNHGQAIGTINRRLSTVRSLCRLAAQAGSLSANELRLIETVKSLTGKAARNIDQNRATQRVGAKKADATLISQEHAQALKASHAPTAQGAKDRLLMCLLIDLGLRAGEVVSLKPTDISLADETIRIYRKKTDLAQTLRMTRDVRKALLEYLIYYAPTDQLLGHSERSLTARVRFHGKRLGYTNLSAHDLRHYLATRLARDGLDAHGLMEAMGWRSLTTAQRYIEDSAIANSKAAAIIDGKQS